jgi:hypothetical protein
MLCIDYYEARQRKNRANSWNDCHSRVEVSRQQAQKKICLDFVHARFNAQVWLQAGQYLAPAAQIPAKQKSGCLSSPRTPFAVRGAVAPRRPARLWHPPRPEDAPSLRLTSPCEGNKGSSSGASQYRLPLGGAGGAVPPLRCAHRARPTLSSQCCASPGMHQGIG